MNHLKARIAEVLFPEGNACHLCGRFPEQPALLCTGCLKALNQLRFKAQRMADADPHPPLLACAAIWPHRGAARDLVHLLKYQCDCAAALLLGDGMAAALALSSLDPTMLDAVIPVPLHAARLEQRGYNQALLLAQAVAIHAQLPVWDGLLIRLHSTDTQIHRDRAQRLLAMQHAFAVTDSRAIHNKRLLLVDDVLTTGATAMACAQALTAAGAASVSLLTACRA